MQNATGSGAAAKSGDLDNTYRTVVADLAGGLVAGLVFNFLNSDDK